MIQDTKALQDAREIVLEHVRFRKCQEIRVVMPRYGTLANEYTSDEEECGFAQCLYLTAAAASMVRQALTTLWNQGRSIPGSVSQIVDVVWATCYSGMRLLVICYFGLT